MNVQSFAVAGPLLLTPRKFEDARGFFSEVYNRRSFEALVGDEDFVQDNQSFSAPSGTIRGLHFQSPPFAQGKLVRVVQGAIFDVAVDLRRSSPTYGKYISAVLNTENWSQLWVPVGFAHGFCTLEANTHVVYKVTNFYSAADDHGIVWNDPELQIPWPVDPAKAVLSDKDQVHPFLADLPHYFD